MDFVAKLRSRLEKSPFSHFGWAPLETPLSMEFYRAWIARGDHATMDYLATSADVKAEPRRHYPRARTAIVVAKAYHPNPYGPAPFQGLRIARYARGRDYHTAFKAELESLAVELRREHETEEFLCCTDTAPLLERDLARRAGLGFFGKNTCLIHPQKGSLFWIGQILCSLDLGAAPLPTIADACGTCDRCIRACPTGAIEEPRRLNASKCISYWTVEARETAPPDLRAKFGDWFFGCDICQTVCPWNQKHYREALLDPEPARSTLESDLRWLLTSSHHQIKKRLQTTPLMRARPAGLKRNALVVVGNLRLRNLLPEVEALLGVGALKEVAEWTRAQLT